MINQQVNNQSYIERLLSMMRKDKTLLEVKADEMKAENIDFTQTKEYWSTFAVIS